MEKLTETVTGLLDKITFLPNYEIKLALIGGVIIFLVFLIALLVATGSKINALRKKLLASTKVLGAMQMVNEENVDVVYKELSTLPESVTKGWGCFMDQRFGYPSDYIPAKDILENKNFKGKNTVGKVLLNLVTLIVLCVGAVLVTNICVGDLQSVGLKDFTANFALVASIISTLLIPVLAWFISFLLLNFRYSRQLRRLEMTYASFQDMLDEKVVIYGSEEEEFVSENLEEIKKKVDELVAGRMGDVEIVEVISSPKVEDVEEVAPLVLQESTDLPPVEEVLPPPVVVEIEQPPVAMEVTATASEQVVPMTKEEERRYLEIVLVVVENALADSATTSEDLESIAALILTAKSQGFEDPADQKILDKCLEKIAEQYFE